MINLYLWTNNNFFLPVVKLYISYDMLANVLHYCFHSGNLDLVLTHIGLHLFHSDSHTGAKIRFS